MSNNQKIQKLGKYNTKLKVQNHNHDNSSGANSINLLYSKYNLQTHIEAQRNYVPDRVLAMPIHMSIWMVPVNVKLTLCSVWKNYFTNDSISLKCFAFLDLRINLINLINLKSKNLCFNLTQDLEWLECTRSARAVNQTYANTS